MSRSSQVQSYREAEILTASKERLLIITYDALIAAMTRAQVGMRMNDHAVTSVGTDRARNLLLELLATLDRKAGGELGDRLAAIYVYLITELSTVVLRGDHAALARHIEMVRELREAFAAAAAEPQALAS